MVARLLDAFAYESGCYLADARCEEQDVWSPGVQVDPTPWGHADHEEAGDVRQKNLIAVGDYGQVIAKVVVLWSGTVLRVEGSMTRSDEASEVLAYLVQLFCADVEKLATMACCFGKRVFPAWFQLLVMGFPEHLRLALPRVGEARPQGRASLGQHCP